LINDSRVPHAALLSADFCGGGCGSDDPRFSTDTCLLRDSPVPLKIPVTNRKKQVADRQRLATAIVISNMLNCQLDG